MSVANAFQSFIRDSNAFRKAVDQSTAASWGGSAYSVELLDDGTYRVLWDQEIGNLYDSPGLILSIPPLSDEEWSEDPGLRSYDNVEQYMKDSFEEHFQANLEVQHQIAFGDDAQ